MLDEKNDSLPLFIHGFDPLKVWVLKDKIITLGKYWQSQTSRLTAFKFLCELYKNKNSRKGIPKAFHAHFEESINKELIIPHFPCIIGEFDLEGRTECLAMKMKIAKVKKDAPVRLFDFKVINCVSCVFSKNFPYFAQDVEVHLSVDEAFFLFANICSSFPNWSLNFSDSQEPFLFQNLQEKIDNEYKRDSKIRTYFHRDAWYQMESFRLLYLQFLLEHFDKRTISPASILRLSGVGVLMYLSDNPVVKSFIQGILYELQNNFAGLTQNQKIQFYTLLRICLKWSNNLKSEIQLFFKNNSHNIYTLKRKLTTPLPEIREHPHLTIPQKQFYKEYKSTCRDRLTK